jgi:hypothetical protein
MSRETDAVLEDIAFIRALAEQGRDAPLRGGWIMISSGVLFGAASLFHWLVQNRLVDLPMADVNIAWMGASALFAVITVASRLHNKSGNAKAHATRAAGIGMAIAVYTLLFVFALAVWRMQNAVVMELFSATLFALYGAFLAVTAAVLEKPALRWLSGGSFVAALLLAVLFDTPHIYLVNAVALVALFVIPGVVLKLRERANQA